METKVENIGSGRLRDYLRRRREGEYLLIDVRQPEEYEQGHIPGAKLIPVIELVRKIHELPAGKDLVFYCRSGARSMAAATLAIEELEGKNRVFNLRGGILAWDGRQLEGWPKVKIFQAALAGDKFRIAMDLEKGALRFYEFIAERFRRRPWAEVFKKLAKAETAHARTIHGYWQKAGGVAADFDTIFNRLEGEILEGGRPLIEALEEVVEVEAGRCLPLMEIALEIENSAFDLYRNLADREENASQAKAFLDLAQAEKAHIRDLVENITACRSYQD